MENKKINSKEENALKDLFAASKLEAGENLKYRIMQQIETESLFAKTHKKEERKISAQINNWLTVLGVGCGLILAVVIGFYLRAGKDFIYYQEFYFSALFIVIVLTAFCLISYFDEKRRKELR